MLSTTQVIVAREHTTAHIHCAYTHACSTQQTLESKSSVSAPARSCNGEHPRRLASEVVLVPQIPFRVRAAHPPAHGEIVSQCTHAHGSRRRSTRSLETRGSFPAAFSSYAVRVVNLGVIIRSEPHIKSQCIKFQFLIWRRHACAAHARTHVSVAIDVSAPSGRCTEPRGDLPRRFSGHAVRIIHLWMRTRSRVDTPPAPPSARTFPSSSTKDPHAVAGALASAPSAPPAFPDPPAATAATGSSSGAATSGGGAATSGGGAATSGGGAATSGGGAATASSGAATSGGGAATSGGGAATSGGGGVVCGGPPVSGGAIAGGACARGRGTAGPLCVGAGAGTTAARAPDGGPPVGGGLGSDIPTPGGRNRTVGRRRDCGGGGGGNSGLSNKLPPPGVGGTRTDGRRRYCGGGGGAGAETMSPGGGRSKAAGAATVDRRSLSGGGGGSRRTAAALPPACATTAAPAAAPAAPASVASAVRAATGVRRVPSPVPASAPRATTAGFATDGRRAGFNAGSKPLQYTWAAAGFSADAARLSAAATRAGNSLRAQHARACTSASASGAHARATALAGGSLELLAPVPNIGGRISVRDQVVRTALQDTHVADDLKRVLPLHDRARKLG